MSMSAQDKVTADINADVVSSYIWRGTKCGNAAIQPGISASWKGLSLGLWGSYGFTDKDDWHEVDVTLSYNIGRFTIAVNDCYVEPFDEDKAEGAEARYFKYAAHTTAHNFELTLAYDFGVVSFNANTIFAGADYNADGDRAFSTYLELTAPFRLGGLGWHATVAAVAMESDFYGTSGFAVTNVTLGATKAIPLSEKFSLNLSAAVTVNPCSENTYLTFGIGI